MAVVVGEAEIRTAGPQRPRRGEPEAFDQLECAEPAVPQFLAQAPVLRLDEGEVEAGVVRDRHGAGEAVGQVPGAMSANIGAPWT